MGLFMSNLEAAAPPALDQHHSSASPPAGAGAFDIRAWHIVVPITLGITLITASECHSITSIPSLRYGFVLAGWWGATALGLWRVAQSRPQFLQLRPAALAVNAAIASLLGIFHLLLMAWMDFLFLTPAVQAAIHLTWMRYLYLNRWGLEMLVYGFIFGVAAVAKLQLLAQRNSMRSLELQKELSAAQLHALQMQVEPHFLFNTLANVTSLIDSDPATAKRMLDSFIRFLRASLAATRMEQTTLGAERELISSFLQVLQVRMGERLRFNIDIAPELGGFELPPMLLQPVVENAIKHGLEPKMDGGEVAFRAWRDGGSVVVEIADTGVGFAPTTRGGVGLSNLRDRLKLLYGERASLQIGENTPVGTRVTVRLPA